jgi:thioredoxin-related protein
MGKQLLLLFLLFFVSCNESEEQKNSHIKTSTITTMPNIHKVYSDYTKAFKVAKEKNRPVFILFTTKYCRWCTKLKETTLKEEEIINRLNTEYVVLLLDKNHSQYPSKYRVTAVPSVYITDKNEEIFTSIVGYHKNPHDYIKWFNYVQVELSN